MIAKNKTKNIVLAENVQALRSFAEKSKGLLGAVVPRAVFFETRWGIHTVGMRFPIDVLILDENFCVKKIARNLLPNRFLFWNPRYKKVVELPYGSLQGTGLGDVLDF